MPHIYSDTTKQNDTYSLPDVEVFQLTAAEAAEMDDELVYEYSKRHEFRLAGLNTKCRANMMDAIIEENGIKGGWFYWFCFPGCMPDSQAMGPYDSYQEAVKAAREENN
jgi:hypothetical protein